MVRGVMRAYGPGLRAIALDTDARTGSTGDLPFTLLGGNRLAGLGTGGQSTSARAAFQDDPSVLDAALGGTRTAVIVTALGGGTGSGATGELLKHLHTLGIVTLTFATLPFAFEGRDRERIARSTLGTIEQHADTTITLPLDTLVTDTDNMKEAFERGVDILASGVTLLWRLLEKPGYISLDSKRLHNIVANGGLARFATATATGPDRVFTIQKNLAESPLLKNESGAPSIKTALVGVLAGDDLLLSEVGSISAGISAACGSEASIALGTVNDETTFSGRLSVVVMLFEQSTVAGVANQTGRTVRNRGDNNAVTSGSIFSSSERSLWKEQDLDVPTYIRYQLTLER